MATGLCFLEDHGGGRTIVDLGTGTISGSGENRLLLFDVSAYPGYKQYTEDNFVIDSISMNLSTSFYYEAGTPMDSISETTSFTKSYDASTGVLTISGSQNWLAHYNTTVGTNTNVQATIILTPSVKLVY